MSLPLAAAAIGLGNVQGAPRLGERLTLTIPLIDAASLQANCIGIVPLPGGSDALYFPHRTELNLKTDREGRPVAVTLSGPTVHEPVIEFRLQTSCGTSIARDYTLLAMPARELRYAPALAAPIEPAVLARPAAPVAETGGTPPAQRARPGPSLEQMAGSRYPDERGKREAFKRQVRALNAEALHGVDDLAPIPLDIMLQFPAEAPEHLAPLPDKKQDVPRKAAKKPAKRAPEPKSRPAPPPAAPAAAAESPAPVQPAVTPALAEKPQDRLQISRGGSADGKLPQPGSAEARLADQAADTFAKQAELSARLEQAERAYHDLKEVILRMEDRMLAIEKERLRLAEENLRKSDWAIPQIVLSILGGGIVGAAVMVLAQNRRRRREADAIFDIGELRSK